MPHYKIPVSLVYRDPTYSIQLFADTPEEAVERIKDEHERPWGEGDLTLDLELSTIGEPVVVAEEPISRERMDEARARWAALGAAVAAQDDPDRTPN